MAMALVLLVERAAIHWADVSPDPPPDKAPDPPLGQQEDMWLSLAAQLISSVSVSFSTTC